MVRPRVHIVSSSKENNNLIVSALNELEPEAETIEHESNEKFLEYASNSNPTVWEIVVTDLIKISMPSKVAGRFMPVIHFTEDSPAINAPNSRKPKRNRSKVVLSDIKEHLKEAISSAKLFIRLKSGIGKFSHLDDRERSVVMMAAEGVPNKTMAKRLNVSIKTIEHCRRKAYLKLDVKSSAEVASLVTFDKFFSLFEAPGGPAGFADIPTFAG